MYTVLHALTLWHREFENGCLLVHCDNSAVICGINKRYIRGATIRPLQLLLLFAALLNIDVVAIWIPTEDNVVADSLSRFDFKTLADLGFKAHIDKESPHVPIALLRQKLHTYLGIASLPQPQKLDGSSQKL